MKQSNHELGGKRMENDRHQIFNKKSNDTVNLREMIENTKENIEEAEISMEFADPEELENLEEKNAHRRQSINQMKEQLKEIQDKKNQ